MAKKEKKKPKYDKRKFIVAFCATMGLFAIIRHGFSINIPFHSSQVASVMNTDSVSEEYVEEDVMPVEEQTDVMEEQLAPTDEEPTPEQEDSLYEESDTSSVLPSSQLQHNGHKIIGVHSWTEAFPDIQPVQLAAAQRNGVTPCANRKEAQRLIKRHKLVNVCNSPLYVVDDLTHSMPYLVPKAQHLLNTICFNFIDSLQSKGLPLHLPVVTSVLRTTDDVNKLQRGNKNATTNSCHCYGTTVDITYNRFMPLVGSYDPNTELTRWNLPMKQVMAEVLRDLREQGRCYVKYEYKQACFHLTVR